MHDHVKDAQDRKPKFQMRWYICAVQYTLICMAQHPWPIWSTSLQTKSVCSHDHAWFYTSLMDIFAALYSTAWICPKTRFGTMHFITEYSHWLCTGFCSNILKVFCSGFCFHVAQVVLTSVLDLLLGSPSIICLTRPWTFRNETNASFQWIIFFCSTADIRMYSSLHPQEEYPLISIETLHAEKGELCSGEHSWKINGEERKVIQYRQNKIRTHHTNKTGQGFIFLKVSQNGRKALKKSGLFQCTFAYIHFQETWIET